MRQICPSPCILVLSILAAPFLSSVPAWSDAGHSHAPAAQTQTLDQIRKMHVGHEHGHDFETIERMSTEDVQRMMGFMVDVGLALPPMDSHRGREVFLNKGCIACHAVNGIGGDLGPSLNAADMPDPMNAFEFAARMWRGASAMTKLQEDLFGEVINLSGQDLADLVAFAHDENEQKTLSSEQIPMQYRRLTAP